MFNLYTEYIMRNAGLDELQAGFKIALRNINNLRYADDNTLIAERTLCEMLGWMKHKLESRMLGEISITSDTQMTPYFWHKVKRN